MKNIARAALVLTLLAAAPGLKAGLLDVRFGAGLSAANPDGFESRVKTLTGNDLTAKSFDTYNADVIFHIPAFPVTVGLRYEQASQNVSASLSEWEMNVNNLAILADWRIINSKVYAGPLVSIGYPWATLKFKNGSNSNDENYHSSSISYSGGLEAGIYLGPFLIGAEAGYRSIRLKEGSPNASSVNANVNLEGMYGKAMIGLTFL